MILFTRDAPSEYRKGAVDYVTLDADFGAEAPVVAALVEELGVLYVERWDYETRIGVMFPETRRAVYVRDEGKGYHASEAGIPKLLAYLRMPKAADFDEGAVTETVLLR